MTTCSNCGYTSKDKGFFRQERGGLWNLKQTVCAGCSPYQPTRYERNIGPRLLVTPCLLAAASFLFRHDPDFNLNITWLMIAGGVLSLPLRIAIHETGHALAAKLVGAQVWQVQIGFGPIRWRTTIWGLRFDWCRYLYAGGITRHSSVTGQNAGIRKAIVISAGPLANLIAAIFAFIAAYATTLSGDIGHPLVSLLVGFGIADVALALSNLIPRQLGFGISSDGQKLLNLLTPEKEASPYLQQLQQILPVVQTRDYEETLRLLGGNYWTSPYRLYLASAIIDALSRCRGDAAVMAFQKTHLNGLRASGDPQTDKENGTGHVLASIAWSALKTRLAEHMEAASTMSMQAMALNPESHPIAATHGAVLTAEGHYEEAIQLLPPSLRGMDSGPDKSEFCEFTAKAYKDAGDEVMAANWHALSLHLSKSL